MSLLDWSGSGSVTVRKLKNVYLHFEPLEDITAYELAKILPWFSGVSYGQGEWSAPEGRVMPVRASVGGAWAGVSVISITEDTYDELDPKIKRHFRKIDCKEEDVKT